MGKTAEPLFIHLILGHSLWEWSISYGNGQFLMENGQFLMENGQFLMGMVNFLWEWSISYGNGQLLMKMVK